MEAPQEGAIAPPTTAAIGGVEPSLQKPRGQMTPSLYHQDAPPMVSPHQQNLPNYLVRLAYLGLQKLPQGVAQ